jgi:hypothetical protein
VDKEYIMIGSNELFIVGFLIVAILLVVVVFALRIGKRSQQDVTFAEALPDEDPLVDRDEFQATPIAEAIEERVRQKVAEDPSLGELDVDFGTGPNGELEIWVNAERYTAIDQVPHKGLQDAIRQAVEDYNQG